MDALLVIIVMALIGTGSSLFLGLLAMSSGGTTERKFGIPLMWTRVAFQGATLLLLVGAVLLR